VLSSSVASSSAHSTSSESDLELPVEGLAAKAPRTAHDLEDEQWDEYVDAPRIDAKFAAARSQILTMCTRPLLPVGVL